MRAIYASRSQDLAAGAKATNAQIWTARDHRAFEDAIEDLRLCNVCRNIWEYSLEDCLEVFFPVNSSRPGGIAWDKKAY